MKPIDYWKLLQTRKNRQEYADRVGCSLTYMTQNLFLGTGWKRRPKDQLLVDLVIESEGHISLGEAKWYFYADRVDRLYKTCCESRNHYHRVCGDDKATPLANDNAPVLD